MGNRREEKVAHVLWWALHIGGLTAILSQPTDLTLAEGIQLQHWLVGLVLSLNVLAHYAVRFSNPGRCTPPPRAADLVTCDCPDLKLPRNRSSSAVAAAAANPCFALPDCEVGRSPPTLLTTSSATSVLASGSSSSGRSPYTPGPFDPLQCPLCGCLRRSPGTTTHCRYCEWCVEGFDHHCLWLGVCVGGRNHHLFARYICIQALTCFLGFHYALTACGRQRVDQQVPPGGTRTSSSSAAGRLYGGLSSPTWSYILLGLMAVLTLLLGLLAATHVLLVLTGQTSRQVVQRVRGRVTVRKGGSSGGGTSGGSSSSSGSSSSAASGANGLGGVGAALGIGRLGSRAMAGQQKQQQQPAPPALRLTAGGVLANAVFLVCGMRPGWLTQSGGMQRVDVWVARCVDNQYYSCC